MQQGELSLAQFLGGRLDGVRVGNLELHAHLRDWAIRRPLGCAEARLGSLRQRPHPEMFAPVDSLAVEVVAALAGLERKAQRVDVELAALRRVRRDHCDARDELNVHAP